MPIQLRYWWTGDEEQKLQGPPVPAVGEDYLLLLPVWQPTVVQY